jgi:PAS domain S-box-containing protein
MTIRGRLQLLAAAMLLPYLLYAAYSVWDVHQRAVRGAIEQSDRDARRVARFLEVHVDRIGALLGAADALAGGPYADPAEVEARLRRLGFEIPEAVSALALFSLDGRVRAATTWSPAERERIDVSDRDYFVNALRTGALAIGAPIQARGTGRWVVPLARPAADEGSVYGVLAATIELDALESILVTRIDSADQMLIVATDRGIAFAGAPGGAALRGRDVSAKPYFRVAREGSDYAGRSTTEDGVTRFAASVPVSNAPWQVFVGTPEQTALQPAYAVLREHLLVAALMFLLAVPAAWWFGRGLVQPILSLRHGVKALARGELAHRIEARASGEVAALAADINTMAAKLGEAERRLRSLAALSSDFFWETDAANMFTQLEGDVGKALGIPAPEALHRPVWELGLRVNGDLAAHLQALERREPFRDVEFVRLAPGGGIAAVLMVSGEPRLGEDGGFLGYRGVARDVTERSRLAAEVTRAHSSLARSEERLRSVVEMSSDWIWETDAEHRITYVSSGVERTLDIDPAPAIGRRRWEGPFLNMTEADWEAHRSLLARRLPFDNLVLERMNRAGRRTVQSVSGRPAYGPGGEFVGYRGVGRDITAQVEAGRALRAERDRLARVLETMAEGLSILDAEGRYALVNASGERILGVPRESLLGRHFTEVPWTREPLEGERGGTPQEVFERLREGATRHLGPGSYVLRRADGTQRILTHQAARLDDGAGGFGGVLVTFEDITERVAADQAHEKEILELNADLERRVEARTRELTAAYKEMESFSYSVSHDLRAPLRAISGFSRILLEDFRGEFPAEAQRLLGRVAQNAERMGALIDGLLEFGRLSRQPLRLQRIRPADVVREVLDELAALREGRRMDIRVGDMPECSADRVLLKQVYANLLANAIKYTGQRPEARIEVGSITMGLGPVYYVRDNGTGFDMAYAGKLFAMFERLHLPSEFEGNGVGLALVRRIVERHGGKVWADSAPDKGATFFFRLGDEAPALRAGDRAAA